MRRICSCWYLKHARLDPPSIIDIIEGRASKERREKELDLIKRTPYNFQVFTYYITSKVKKTRKFNKSPFFLKVDKFVRGQPSVLYIPTKGSELTAVSFESITTP